MATMTNATTASAIRKPDHVWHGNLQHYDLGSHRPLEIVRGEGCWVWDSDNHRYLDGMAGLWCVNVGYGRRSIADAVAEQMNLAALLSPDSVAPACRAAGDRLTEILPADLDHIFFVNSGSEAVETALKIARQCARRMHPGENRYKIIARHRGYHGFTMGAMSATGQVARKQAFEPLMPGFLHVAPPDPYRCDHCSAAVECTLACANEFERTIRSEGPETVAAVILEPAIGGGGVFPAPRGYMEQVREICDRYGVLMIVDEVITGFGRTGKLFAIEHSGIPTRSDDVAKGITSGYLPLGPPSRAGKFSRASSARITTRQSLPRSAHSVDIPVLVLQRSPTWKSSRANVSGRTLPASAPYLANGLRNSSCR